MLKADADISAMTHQAKVSLTKSKGLSSENIINEASIKVVMAGSGCDNAEEVEQVSSSLRKMFIYVCVCVCGFFNFFWFLLLRSYKVLVSCGCPCSAIWSFQVLQQLDGEVDAAIEFLVAKQQSEEDVDDNKLPHQLDTSYGNGWSVNICFGSHI